MEGIEEKIAALKKEISEVKGSPCEVFSRVSGYLRPTSNWNKGKQAEFTMRKKFNVEGKVN